MLAKYSDFVVNYENIYLQVQVIPWVLTDSNFVRSASQKLDPNRTVFVGGLHGMINAGLLFPPGGGNGLEIPAPPPPPHIFYQDHFFSVWYNQNVREGRA